MHDTSSPAIPQPQRPRRDKALWRHTRTIIALMLREMTSRYGNSPGGYIWAVLEPLGMIVILSLAFGLIMRSPSLGNSFILFYATGFLPFNMFMVVSRHTMTALNFSKALLNYPAVSWFDAVTARAVLNFLTEALVSYILLAGILVVVDTNVVLQFGPILQAYLMAGLLGLGIGLVNCVFIGFVPVWGTVWSILTRPLFLASGIFFLISDLPAAAQDLLWYNPLMHVTAVARTGFYPMYDPQYVSFVFVMVVALSSTALGALLLRRYHREILSRG